MTDDDVTGRMIYERKIEAGETWAQVATHFGISRGSARSRARTWQRNNNLPTPEEAAEIHGGIDEEPRVNGRDQWARAIKLQTRRAQVRESKEQRRVAYREGPVVLFFMADLHLGGEGVNYLAIDQDIRLINDLARRGVTVAVVLGGDLIDNYIIGKLQRLRLNQSPFLAIEEWALADYALERLAPYVIGSVAGNHDNWSWAVAGVDLLRQRHQQLTPGILYDPYELAFTLQVAASETRVIVRHAWKGNSKYNPTHGIEDHHWTRGRDADVYVSGHTHRGGLAREFDNGGRVGWAIICGTYKDEDSYGMRLGLPPVLPTAAVALVVDDDGVQFATSNIYALPRTLVE